MQEKTMPVITVFIIHTIFSYGLHFNVNIHLL